MGILSCRCRRNNESKDLADVLSDFFGAHIIRVPEEVFQPLQVLATKDGEVYRRGDLAHLLEGNPPPELTGDELIEISAMASLSGKRTSKYDLDLGLSVLEGFLSGFGVPGGGGIEAGISGARSTEFSFSGVERSFVDINLLGKIISSRRLDGTNPSYRLFEFPSEYNLLVVDSTIRSNNFTINFHGEGDRAAEVNIDAVKDVIGKAEAGVSVAKSSDTALTFAGPQSLAFAFTAVQFFVDDQERVVSMPPGSQDVLKASDTLGPDQAALYSPNRARLSGPGDLLQWDQME